MKVCSPAIRLYASAYKHFKKGCLTGMSWFGGGSEFINSTLGQEQVDTTGSIATLCTTAVGIACKHVALLCARSSDARK